MMKYFLFVVVAMVFASQAMAQKSDAYTTRSKKAIKFYQDAGPFIIRRQFPQAISLLQQAIDKDDEFTEAHFRIGTVYMTMDNLDQAQYHLKRVIALSGDDPEFAKANLALAGIYLDLGQYEKSLAQIKQFKTFHIRDKKLVERMKKLEANAAFAVEKIKEPLDFKPKALPGAVNKFALQYFPVLTADNQFLIFTGREGASPQFDEDIFISRKANGHWLAPASLSDKINTEYNEGTCAISADGRMLIFTSCVGRKGYGSCDLFVSYKTGDEWSEPENMGNSINSGAWESQPTLSADGRTLYFISDRRGGFGKRDIWVSSLDADNQWSVAVNLGKPVNSPDDEVSPFIHVNGQTLYFASKGYPGFGGFDLYYSNKTGEGWRPPVNLGYPLNNSDDQVSLFVTANGEKGYYSYEQRSQGRYNNSFILMFDIPEEIRVTNSSNYVTGKVYDAETGKTIGARVELYDILEDTLKSTVTSDSINGEYLIVLTEGAEYALYVSKPGYLFESLSFNYRDSKNREPIHIDIRLQPIKTGIKTTLKNIFFETDKYEIQDKSKTELVKVVNFMDQNPGIRIEIGGHTDNSGTSAYNRTLSINRAKAVYDYLINAGVAKNRLVYKGYGEQEPVAANDTEENMQLNRRIEFKVVE